MFLETLCVYIVVTVLKDKVPKQMATRICELYVVGRCLKDIVYSCSLEKFVLLKDVPLL